MPIVDGLTSTKMIRSFEKTHADVYSKRAALNGRIPIIAVSASLLENKRQEYIDTGFDAWILKPIAFQRLNTILAAIVDPAIREDCLYQPGEWEQGGWFHMGQKSSQEANTKPSCGPPQLKSSIAHQEAAHSDANSDDPFVDDKVISLPDGESQPRGKGKSVHYDDELQSPTHVSAETPSEPPAEPPSGE
jgi:CheY-like chemotaxis protein